MSSRLTFILCILFAISQLSVSMQRPHRNDVSSVADALKYLQELDSIYSQISRPRFGKRSGLLKYLNNKEEQKDDQLQAAAAAEDEWQLMSRR